MPRIKLEGLTQPFESIKSGVQTGAAGITGAAAGITGAAKTSVQTLTGAATTGATAGFTGVFSLGRGFRDFILRGTVVELAVAVVLGTAFTDLISSATKNFITPLIAAIFAGSNFAELSFTINGSQFGYGDFINAFLTFIFVIGVLYFCVVVPLEKLQFAAFKHRAIMRDCPFCFEEISMAATRCKHCAGEVPLSEEMQHTLQLATAAMDAEEVRKQHKWYRRMWAPCAKMCKCCQPKQAMVQQGVDGQVQLADVAQGSSPVVSSPLSMSMSMRGSGVMQRVSSSSIGAGHIGTAFVSPQQSFSSAAGTSGPAATAIDIEALTQEQQKTK